MDFGGLEAIECSLEDGLLEIVLSRPEKGNCFGVAFCNDLNRVFSEASERSEVRSVLISARGRFFSVGGDINLLAGDAADRPALTKALTSPLHMAITRMMMMNAPVVCAINGGGAFGGAVAFLAATDIVVASRTARFGSAFTGIGFSCDSGSTIGVMHRMGLSRAKRFMLLGETLTADAAHATGLVDILCDEAELDREAREVARKLADGPTLAYGEIKRLFLQSASMPLAMQLEHEAIAIARACRTADATEGLTAFIEKRKPHFRGA